MNNTLTMKEIETNVKALDELRDDNARRQKCGLPFIAASVLIWTMIAVVTSLDIKINIRNWMVFFCSCPLMPLAMLAAKIFKVNIFDNANPLGKLGFLFTMNQMLYIFIAMWAMYATPSKMVMVYAMIFGAHLLPYFWLYKTKTYLVTSIVLTFGALIIDSLFSTQIMAIVFAVYEGVFAFILWSKTYEKRLLHNN